MREWEIRRALCGRLREEHRQERTTLLIEELGICQGTSRIDVAVVNGVFSGFEIKSPQDTLERLPKQRDSYNQVFDYVTVVTSSHHLSPLFEIVPEWWGVMVAEESTEGIRFETARSAERNEFISPHAVVKLLWKEEALQILEGSGLARGIKGKPRKYAWERLVEAYPNDELYQIVRETLKGRHSWRENLMHSSPLA